MKIDLESLCTDLFKIYKKYELDEVWLRLAGAIRVMTFSNDNKIYASQLRAIIGDKAEVELIWGILKTLEKNSIVTMLQDANNNINEVFKVNDEFMIQRAFETVKLLGSVENQDSCDDTLYWTPPKEVNLNFRLLKNIKRIDSLINNLITQSRDKLVFLAPFYSVQGLERIAETLIPLIKNQKSIKIDFFCNDLDNFDKRNRVAFKRLNSIVKKECGAVPYNVYIPNPSAQKYENILIHAKFILSDNMAGYLGSANISKSALESQLELGVRISRNQCELISKIIDKLIKEKYFLNVTNNI